MFVLFDHLWGIQCASAPNPQIIVILTSKYTTRSRSRAHSCRREKVSTRTTDIRLLEHFYLYSLSACVCNTTCPCALLGCTAQPRRPHRPLPASCPTPGSPCPTAPLPTAPRSVSLSHQIIIRMCLNPSLPCARTALPACIPSSSTHGPAMHVQSAPRKRSSTCLCHSTQSIHPPLYRDSPPTPARAHLYFLHPLHHEHPPPCPTQSHPFLDAHDACTVEHLRSRTAHYLTHATIPLIQGAPPHCSSYGAGPQPSPPAPY